MHSEGRQWIEERLGRLMPLKFFFFKLPSSTAVLDLKGPTNSDCFHSKSMFYPITTENNMEAPQKIKNISTI